MDGLAEAIKLVDKMSWPEYWDGDLTILVERLKEVLDVEIFIRRHRPELLTKLVRPDPDDVLAVGNSEAADRYRYVLQELLVLNADLQNDDREESQTEFQARMAKKWSDPKEMERNQLGMITRGLIPLGNPASAEVARLILEQKKNSKPDNPDSKPDTPESISAPEGEAAGFIVFLKRKLNGARPRRGQVLNLAREYKAGNKGVLSDADSLRRGAERYPRFWKA